MKLQNKKTGEIVIASINTSCSEIVFRYHPLDNADDINFKKYCSIYGLNAEWEDYEEPDVFYFIDRDGRIIRAEREALLRGLNSKAYDYEMAKSIGNVFETKEEAGKAVEKLKAWKRLKDKGHKFGGIYGDYILSENKPVLMVEINGDTDEQDKADLKLLFGGEE